MAASQKVIEPEVLEGAPVCWIKLAEALTSGVKSLAKKHGFRALGPA